MLGRRVISQELMELGSRIRRRRTELGLSQEELAERAGISANTVSRIEGGQMAMSVETFRKLVEILIVEADYLLDTENVLPEEKLRIQKMVLGIYQLREKEQKIVMDILKVFIEKLGK